MSLLFTFRKPVNVATEYPPRTQSNYFATLHSQRRGAAGMDPNNDLK
jgi:hypothetical protein